MCDEVEPAAMYSRKHRRARKSYACEACSETIAAGAMYVAHSGLNDDEWWTVRQCERCDAITTVIMARSTECVALRLDCGETWLEAFGTGAADRYVAGTDGVLELIRLVDAHVPPEVQALAFALPGEVMPRNARAPVDRHVLAQRRRDGAEWEALKLEYGLTEGGIRSLLDMARAEEAERPDSGWRLTPRAAPRRGGFLLMGPYDQPVIADLKHSIPQRHRRYSLLARGWVIACEAEAEAREVVGRWAPRPTPMDPADTRTEDDFLAEALADIGVDDEERAAALELSREVLRDEGLDAAIVLGRELLGDTSAEMWPL